ncbi:NADH:flavin oxidoreductase/NADH oxidase [SAR202 cluster bacterium AD-804-J14_MRT_500m]|nr:NADH:flavin oxidoreductase/NADH oxidase [SAR202 cluster bacterium AD-804-J14_MRT_500m]
MSKLFDPIHIRGQLIKNRAFVAPMCQYSAEGEDGKPTSWHMVHLGSRAVGGAGLVMFEATAVTPEGRISPQDLGIWSDDHVEQFAKISDFITEQRATPAIQLAHAGRKASHDIPWAGGAALTDQQSGWQISAPSPLPYDESWPAPQELTIPAIHAITKSFASAARRSVEANIKVIELHFAHGYLLSEFHSPISNHRTDLYGGSFENRTRFSIEIVDAIRDVIPESLPLFVRLSSTEYVNGGWDIEDSVMLSKELKSHGVDLIDCSSGGNSPDQQMTVYPGYQVQFAHQIRKSSDIMTGAVGLITDPHQAEDILNKEQADVIFLGRELLRNPYWPLQAQQALDSSSTLWKDQYSRAIP